VHLKVLQTDIPWYADGLTFTCAQCGNCCTGAPGYVWISDEEIGRMAKHLKISRATLLEKYCRRIGNRYSLKETRTPEGNYDCIFLKEVKTRSRNGVGGVKKICSVYEVRPLQCRTWPFWDGILASKESWKDAGKRCHGIDNGTRKFTREQIESLRDAEDWPENPPTSGK
jgi:Fe-S-cluster containining protein